jgi:serine protease Do
MRRSARGIIGRTAAGAVAVAAVVTVAILACRAATDGTPAAPSPEVTAPARALGDAFAAVAAAVRPGVVSVYSEKSLRVQVPEQGFPFDDDLLRRFFGEQAPQGAPHRGGREFRVPQRGMGSGMIIDREGRILTNNHVVAEVDEIKVQLADKRQFEARVVATDPKTDVAVIQIKGAVPADLPLVVLGDSDALRVGDLVMAIGAPFGLTQTVTTGIISATRRADVGIASYEDFLQTDAAINPGNSGGPLVNMRGEVIGMNSAIAGSAGQFAGVGFAIPAAMIRDLLPKLTKGEAITRGQIGVVIQELTKDLAAQFGVAEDAGVLVAQVSKDSPAQQGGVRAGDVIVRFQGKPVKDTRALRNAVAATAPGTRVDVAVIRDGRERTLTLTVGKQPAEAAAAAEEAPAEGSGLLEKLGLDVEALTPQLAARLQLEDTRGLVVTAVEEGSPASAAGLQQGDVIVEANRSAVATAAELRRALEGADKAKGALLLVHRRGGSMYLVLRRP